MKTKFFLTFGFFLFILLATAQQSGIVEYEYIYHPGIHQKDKDSLTLMKRRALSLAEKAYEYAQYHDYVLLFNPDESYYYVDAGMEVDEVEDPVSYKFSLMILGKGVYYQNRKEGIQLNQKESLNELYLVSDTIRNDWHITNETKKIAGFTVYKATKPCKCGQDIEAWFAPDIPVPFGPAGFNGLPGLILEVTKYKHTLRAKKIKLLNKPLKIKRPEKGKPITEEELHRKFTEYRERARRQHAR